jgi:galactokinase
MTGGGFGGCTVNLVRQEQVDQFCEVIAREYQTQSGIRGSTYLVCAADGVQEIQMGGMN